MQFSLFKTFVLLCLVLGNCLYMYFFVRPLKLLFPDRHSDVLYKTYYSNLNESVCTSYRSQYSAEILLYKNLSSIRVKTYKIWNATPTMSKWCFFVIRVRTRFECTGTHWPLETLLRTAALKRIGRRANNSHYNNYNNNNNNENLVCIPRERDVILPVLFGQAFMGRRFPGSGGTRVIWLVMPPKDRRTV